MITEVTLRQLREWGACKYGIEYWEEVNKPNVFDFIEQCKVDEHLDWAIWLMPRCMDRKQYLKWVLYDAV